MISPSRLRVVLTTALGLILVAVVAVPQARAASFNIGDAANYALLFEGGGGNTLQITNVTVGGTGGNVGVGNTGRATDSGLSTISGAINFSAANTGQFSNNNVANVITGGVHYNVAAVTTDLNTINSLSQTLLGDAGTAVAITGNTTINASAGTLFTVNGQSVRVFDATSFTNGGGQTLTINGSASDLVAINLAGLGNIQFHGGIAFTGGINGTGVVFNLGGGNYSTLTGAASLDINNNGGTAGIAQGIFLDPNGAISVVNATVLGQVFGGDSHDFQYVSGAAVTNNNNNQNAGPVPEPASLVLLGTGLAFFGKRLRRRGK